MKFISVFFIILWLFALPFQAIAQTSSERSLIEKHLRQVMPKSLVAISTVDLLGQESIEIKKQGGRSFLEMRVFRGQTKVSNGIRSEISINYPFQNGDTVIYQWDFRIEKDFRSDAPKNRFWIFGQLHDQPDQRKGETWRNFPKLSPPISINYGMLGQTDYIGLIYGSPKMSLIEKAPIKRDTWHRIKLVIKWSTGENGTAKAFLDGRTTPFASAKGRNMHNDYQHYFKLGMYRHKAIASDNAIHIDNVSIRHAN